VVEGELPVVATPTGEVVVGEGSGVALGPPRRRVADAIWLIVVTSFAVVMVGSAIALLASMFVPAVGPTRPELVLTLFTGATGFLGGLLVQRPHGG
jgi:hypothetical protein